MPTPRPMTSTPRLALFASVLAVSVSSLAAKPKPTPAPSVAPAGTVAVAIDNSLVQKLANLENEVAKLPSSTVAERLKNASLGVDLEWAKECVKASLPSDANALLAEVEIAMGKPADILAAASSNTATVGALKPPRVAAGNPYLDRMVAGARAELAKPDKTLGKNTAKVNVFSGLGGDSGSRSVGEEMQAWLWLLANPASPLRGNPQALAHFLRLSLAYADAMDIHGAASLNAPERSGRDENAPKAGEGIFDDFAIAPAACAIREFAQLYPNLLLPSQKAQWDRAMRNAGAIMMGKAKDREGVYANIDLALAYELLNFGLYLNKPDYLEKSRFLTFVQEKSVYPDGGIAYIGHQNESHGYHDGDVRELARMYEVDGDPKLLELIRKTEWYGPVTSGKLAEFWTVPSWKDTWNASRMVVGGESVACVTGNPYLRGMLDLALAKPPVAKHWAENRISIPWYRNDVKPLPLPDNYTVLDRNINGPRAWYGRFNYAATLRPIPQTEPGLATIMGAQVTEADGSIENVLMGAYPRVRLKKEIVRKAGPPGSALDGAPVRQSYAWLTSGLKSAIVVGRSFSAVAGDYRLAQYGSSGKGPDTDWNGRQIWLGLPDRIIGLLEVSAAKEGAAGWEVDGVLRLGTGGTVNGKPTTIKATGKESWLYGDLAISLLGHNFAAVQTPEVPFRLPKAPATEITLIDERGASDPQAPSSYPLSSNYWFLVEVKTAWAAGSATVRRLEPLNGVLGFECLLGNKQFILLDNPSESEARYSSPKLGGSGSRTFRSSLAATVQPAVPAPLLLKPHELNVIVTSPEPEDSAPGWLSYQQMILSMSKSR